MKNRFWLFRRGQTYYVEDSLTHKQESLGTKDGSEARQLREAKNIAAGQPSLGVALAKAYLSSHDPRIGRRTWTDVMKELASHGKTQTQERCHRAMRSRPFNRIRHRPLIETTSDDFLEVLRLGGTSTNNYLRRLHNL